MPLENVAPRLLVGIYTNVVNVVICISGTTVAGIGIVQLAKIPKKKSGFWQGRHRSLTRDTTIWYSPSLLS
jgi:hypothetical protein